MASDAARHRFDAILVGGGHNGLVAAFYLARAGLSVCVLERRHSVGGPASTFEFFPGYRGAITNSPGSSPANPGPARATTPKSSTACAWRQSGADTVATRDEHGIAPARLSEYRTHGDLPRRPEGCCCDRDRP